MGLIVTLPPKNLKWITTLSNIMSCGGSPTKVGVLKGNCTCVHGLLTNDGLRGTPCFFLYEHILKLE